MSYYSSYSSGSRYDDLVDSGVLTLDILLDDDNVKAEVKSSSKLVEFVTQPENLETLVQLITEDPTENASQNRCLKFPYAAVDIFTTNVDEINDALLDRADLMTKLFGFLLCPSFKTEPLPTFAQPDQEFPSVPTSIVVEDKASEETKEKEVSTEASGPIKGVPGKGISKNAKRRARQRARVQQAEEERRRQQAEQQKQRSLKSTVSTTSTTTSSSSSVAAIFQNGAKVTEAGLSQRVVMGLLDSSSFPRVLTFMKQQNVSVFINRIAAPAATEILTKMLSSTNPIKTAQWLTKTNFFGLLVQKLSSETNPSDVDAIIQFLVDNMFRLCEAKDNERGLFIPLEPDFPSLTPPPVVVFSGIINSFIKNFGCLNSLLKTAIKTKNYRILQVLSKIVRFCSNSPYPSAYCNIAYLAPYAISTQRKTFPSQFIHEPKKTALQQLEFPIFKVLCNALPILGNELTQAKTASLFYSSIVELIADLSESGFESVSIQLAQSNISKKIMNLCFSNPFNSFLHFSVFRFVFAAIISPVKQIKLNVIKDNAFFHRFMKMDSESSKNAFPNNSLGFVGPFSLLCELLTEAGTMGSPFTTQQRDEVLEIFKQVKYPDAVTFETYCENVLAGRKKLNSIELAESTYFPPPSSSDSGESLTEDNDSSGEVVIHDSDDDDE